MEVQLESRQSITSSCMTSHTLLSMWKRKLVHASSISVGMVSADDGSSLRVVASLLTIAKEDWLRGLTIFMDLCGSQFNLRVKQEEIKNSETIGGLSRCEFSDVDSSSM